MSFWALIIEDFTIFCLMLPYFKLSATLIVTIAFMVGIVSIYELREQDKNELL